jgi:hypothetical protein
MRMNTFTMDGDYVIFDGQVVAVLVSGLSETTKDRIRAGIEGIEVETVRSQMNSVYFQRPEDDVDG